MALDQRDYYRQHIAKLEYGEPPPPPRQAAVKPAETDDRPFFKKYPAWLLWLAALGAIYNVTLALRLIRWLTHH